MPSKAIKPRIAWQDSNEFVLPMKAKGDKRVLVLDLGAASRTDLRLCIAEAIAESYGGDHFSPICLRATEAVLKAIGISPVKPKHK